MLRLEPTIFRREPDDGLLVSLTGIVGKRTVFEIITGLNDAETWTQLADACLRNECYSTEHEGIEISVDEDKVEIVTVNDGAVCRFTVHDCDDCAIEFSKLANALKNYQS